MVTVYLIFGLLASIEVLCIFFLWLNLRKPRKPD